MMVGRAPVWGASKMGRRRRHPPQQRAAQRPGTPAPTPGQKKAHAATPNHGPKAASKRKRNKQSRAEKARRAALAAAPVTSDAGVVLFGTPSGTVTPLWTETPPESAPALWDGRPGTPAGGLSGPLAGPAHFDARATLSGDLAAPAPFLAGALVSGSLAAPAAFSAASGLSGPLAAPADFDAPVVHARPPSRRRGPGPAAPVTGSPLLNAAVVLLVVGGVGVGGVLWQRATRPAPVLVVAQQPQPPQPVYARLHQAPVWPAAEARFDPLPARAAAVVIRGNPTRPKVALTFDACSTTRFLGWEGRIMEILERHEVPATFFLGGRLVEQRPEIAQLLAQNPLFDLQNHTFVHPHLPEVPPARVVEELQRTDFAVFAATGRRAVLFRPPFGEYSADVVKAATRAGYLPIQYDIASGDPDPGFHWNKLLESVVRQVVPGSIVVMHANGNGFHTASALPLIIEVLRDRGFELTTVWDVLAQGTWVTDDGRKGPQRKKVEKAADKTGAPGHGGIKEDRTPTAVLPPRGVMP